MYWKVVSKCSRNANNHSKTNCLNWRDSNLISEEKEKKYVVDMLCLEYEFPTVCKIQSGTIILNDPWSTLSKTSLIYLICILVILLNQSGTTTRWKFNFFLDFQYLFNCGQNTECNWLAGNEQLDNYKMWDM